MQLLQRIKWKCADWKCLLFGISPLTTPFLQATPQHPPPPPHPHPHPPSSLTPRSQSPDRLIDAQHPCPLENEPHADAMQHGNVPRILEGCLQRTTEHRGAK